MRPAILDKLFAPVTALPGIGSQIAKLFERLAGPLVLDLVWHLPSGIIDRRASPPIRALEPDRIATIAVRVEAHQPGFGRRPYRVLCTDNTGTLTLVYFNVKGDQLARLLPIGAERVVSGRVEFYGSMPQMAHPDLVLRPDELDRLKPIEPVYPLTAGLVAARRAEGGRGGARPPPGVAGMDRSGVARAAGLARLGRGGPPGACPGGRSRSFADHPGARAARL